MEINSAGVVYRNQIRPPIAYGKVNSAGGLTSGSTNIAEIEYYYWQPGEYRISFDDPLLDTDIVVASLEMAGTITARVVTGEVLVLTYATSGTQTPVDRDFAFVVYRP